MELDLRNMRPQKGNVTQYWEEYKGIGTCRTAGNRIRKKTGCHLLSLDFENRFRQQAVVCENRVFLQTRWTSQE